MTSHVLPDRSFRIPRLRRPVAADHERVKGVGLYLKAWVNGVHVPPLLSVSIFLLQWKKFWFVLTDHSLRYYKDSIAEEVNPPARWSPGSMYSLRMIERTVSGFHRQYLHMFCFIGGLWGSQVVPPGLMSTMINNSFGISSAPPKAPQ